METGLRKFMHAWKRFHFFMGLAGGFVFFGLMLFVTGYVGTRAFGAPVPATVDIIEALLPIGAFLPCVYTQLEGSHVRLDFLTSRLSPRARLALDIFAYAVCAFVFLMLGIKTLDDALVATAIRQTSGTYPVPIYPAKLVLPVMYFLFTLHCVISIPIKFIKENENWT